MNDTVQDARPNYYYRIDNAFYLHWAKEVGVYGLAVYNALCYYADRSHRCFPSVSTLAKELSCGETTIKAAIKVLAASRLIAVNPRTKVSADGNESPTSNEYVILPVPIPSEGPGGVGRDVTQGGSLDDPGVGRHATTNKTYLEQDLIKKEEEEDSKAASLPSTTKAKPVPPPPPSDGEREIQKQWHHAIAECLKTDVSLLAAGKKKTAMLQSISSVREHIQQFNITLDKFMEFQTFLLTEHYSAKKGKGRSERAHNAEQIIEWFAEWYTPERVDKPAEPLVEIIDGWVWLNGERRGPLENFPHLKAA